MGISLRCFMGLSFLSLVFAFFSSAYSIGTALSAWASSSEGPRSRKVRRIAGPRDPSFRGSRSSFLPSRSVGVLLADPETLDGRAVLLDILPLQVVEQAATLAH